MLMIRAPVVYDSVPLRYLARHSSNPTFVCMSDNRTVAPSSPKRTSISAMEARVSLVFALTSQTASISQRFLEGLVSETVKYVFPRRFDSQSWEEALMAVPDLETVKFKVLSRKNQYEIREVEPYSIAETTMPGKYGFDFNGASQSFNVLAEYLFGKNTTKERMEMTTPVFTRKSQSDGEKMEMTTPVITKKLEDGNKWQMSFVMPSKYGSNLPVPKDSAVRIIDVPRKIVAVSAFSGFVTDEEVSRRELALRNALKNDNEFKVKDGATVEIAQYNPPFTLPFTRRNEIALEMSPGFSYSGDNGPDKWGSLSPDYATCQSGKLQSPINIADDKIKPNKDLKGLDRDYKVCNASFINRRFFVELNLGNAGELNFEGKEYIFKKITFHTPSEHTIDGKQYDVEAHLVHAASDGSRTIIAVLYQIGNADPLLAKLQNQLKELGNEQCGANEVSQIAVDNFNAPKLERGTRKYYHYVGSLTSPPCTENINYIILGKVRSISKDQVELLKAPLDSKCKGNSRPLQPLNDRYVELYSESD